MSTKGRHSGGGSGGFYRDLLMMIVSIILVGAAVFFLLFLLADGPTESDTTVASPDTTTTTAAAEPTTTSGNGESTTTSTTEAPTTTVVPVRPPEEVRVVVLNSVGIPGAAGRLTEELEEAGYQTLPADDYEPELDPSRIWYRESFSAEANELLSFIPDANVEPLPEPDLQPGADVIIILGTGYEE